MAEVKNADQSTLLSKRSSDLGSSDPTSAIEPKKQKLETLSDEKTSTAVAYQKKTLNGSEENPEDEKEGDGFQKGEDDEKTSTAVAYQKKTLSGSEENPEDEKEGDGFQKREADEETSLKGVESEAGKGKEEGGEGEERKDGNSNGEAVIDRKGKGILIEGEEDDSDDNDEDGSDDDDDDSGDEMDNASDEDSDFVEDPLTEVDLENILPSRTRGRVVHPDAYTASDLADDDSDDSDA